MAREREIKIQLKIPLNEFIVRISGLGFEKKSETVQRDNYFDTPDWRLYKNVAALRTRQVDGADHSFSFKKLFRVPEKKDPIYIEEIETKFPAADNGTVAAIFDRLQIAGDGDGTFDCRSIGDILLKNGFQGEQVLLKTRQAFGDSKENEIAIDDVEHVGTVVELECANGEPMEFVGTLLSDGEWGRSVEGTSYAWLEKVKGFTDHLSHQSKFDEDPAWNVWENEKEMYKRLS